MEQHKPDGLDLPKASSNIQESTYTSILANNPSGPQQQPFVKRNTQYTNSILKFKLSNNIQNSLAVAEFT